MRSAYHDLLHEMPFCGACGMESPPSNWGGGVWRLERAHLGAGSGTMLREEDRRAVVTLCTLHHYLHSHYGGRTVNVNGVLHQQLGDANVIWIKSRRDPAYFDWDYIKRIWNGAPPYPEEPDWLKDEYAINRNIPSWKTGGEPIAVLEEYWPGRHSMRTIGLIELYARIYTVEELKDAIGWHHRGSKKRRVLDTRRLTDVHGIGDSTVKAIVKALENYDAGIRLSLDPGAEKRRREIQRSWTEAVRRERQVIREVPAIISVVRELGRYQDNQGEQ